MLSLKFSARAHESKHTSSEDLQQLAKLGLCMLCFCYWLCSDDGIVRTEHAEAATSESRMLTALQMKGSSCALTLHDPPPSGIQNKGHLPETQEVRTIMAVAGDIAQCVQGVRAIHQLHDSICQCCDWRPNLACSRLTDRLLAALL